MLRHPDVLSGAVLVLCAAGLGFLVQGIDINAGQATLTARFFPTVVAACFALCGVGLVIKGLRSPAQPLPSFVNRRLMMVGLVLTAYFLSFDEIDFRIGTFVMMAFVMWILGTRRPASLVLVAAGVTAALYVLFRYAFVILLPTWT